MMYIFIQVGKAWRDGRILSPDAVQVPFAIDLCMTEKG